MYDAVVVAESVASQWSRLSEIHVSNDCDSNSNMLVRTAKFTLLQRLVVPPPSDVITVNDDDDDAAKLQIGEEVGALATDKDGSTTALMLSNG